MNGRQIYKKLRLKQKIINLSKRKALMKTEIMQIIIKIVTLIKVPDILQRLTKKPQQSAWALISKNRKILK